MFQKFNEDTLGSRFIKSLLAQTSIPLFDCVIDGDYIVSGIYYIYGAYIIRCTLSGLLGGSDADSAEYTIISRFDEDNNKTSSTYMSLCNYYDSETHYNLGRYLRFLRTTTGLNLMPYYNCFSSKVLTDLELTYDSNQNIIPIRSEKQQNKVIAVPILFGKRYSIALDCPSNVLMRLCLYDSAGFFDDSVLSDESKSVLNSSGKSFGYMFFNQLETYTTPQGITKELALLQKNLYLVIQLPKSNDSSIVVLENYEDKTGIYCNKDSVREVRFANLSLLQMNTRSSYAFSDRLIEYLMGNVIHSHSDISTNIQKIQDALSEVYPEYNYRLGLHKYIRGTWDEDIPRYILQEVENYAKDHNIYDQDGNINKDTEAILHNKGGYY